MQPENDVCVSCRDILNHPGGQKKAGKQFSILTGGLGEASHQLQPFPSSLVSSSILSSRDMRVFPETPPEVFFPFCVFCVALTCAQLPCAPISKLNLKRGWEEVCGIQITQNKKRQTNMSFPSWREKKS